MMFGIRYRRRRLWHRYDIHISTDNCILYRLTLLESVILGHEIPLKILFMSTTENMTTATVEPEKYYDMVRFLGKMRGGGTAIHWLSYPTFGYSKVYVFCGEIPE